MWYIPAARSKYIKMVLGWGKGSPSKGSNAEDEKKVLDPIALASSFEPLKRASAREETNVYTGAAMKRTERLQGPQTNNLDLTAVAPYQAMPVHGPLITHNKASGLEVVENGDGALSVQVRGAASLFSELLI